MFMGRKVEILFLLDFGTIRRNHSEPISQQVLDCRRNNFGGFDRAFSSLPPSVMANLMKALSDFVVPTLLPMLFPTFSTLY
jgi:hypothetical protein